MGKHRDLDTGNALPASWTDALQEYISSYATAFQITRVGTPFTSLRLPASAGDGLKGLGFGGPWRYNTANADAAMPGGSAPGSYDVLAVASANDFANAPTPGVADLDNTDYTFGLRIVATGGSATGTHNGKAIALQRKIATCAWNGTDITDVYPLVGGFPHPATIGAATQAALDSETSARVNADVNLPTTGQKAALAGTTGAPGDSNRYVTSTDPRFEGGTLAPGFVQTIGNGSARSIDVRHNFGSANVLPILRVVATGEVVQTETIILDGNTVRFVFDQPPASASIIAMILGGGADPPPPVGAYTLTVGDGATSGPFTVSHGLSTRDVVVEAYVNAPPYDTVQVDHERTDVNTVTIRTPGVVPPTNGLRVIVMSRGGVQGAASQHAAQHEATGNDPVGGVLPVGSSAEWSGDADPVGGKWMIEDGRTLNAVADATLMPLFTAIGTKYGGTGASAFNLPDSQGRITVAKGTHAEVNAIGKSDALAVGSRKIKHQHGLGTLASSTNVTGAHRHALTLRGNQGPGASQFIQYTNLTQVISTVYDPDNPLAGDHNHVVTHSGAVGDTAGPTDGPAYIVKNKIIRVR